MEGFEKKIKLDIQSFFEELKESLLENETKINRVIKKSNNRYNTEILPKIWCIYTINKIEGRSMNRKQIGELLGSKAKAKGKSSITKIITLYRLIVHCKLTKLTRICPTTEQKDYLIKNHNAIGLYFSEHPDPFWQSGEEDLKNWSVWN